MQAAVAVRLAGVVALALSAAGAAAHAPLNSPLPQPRPGTLVQPPDAAASPVTAAAAIGLAPVHTPKPLPRPPARGDGLLPATVAPLAVAGTRLAPLTVARPLPRPASVLQQAVVAVVAAPRIGSAGAPISSLFPEPRPAPDSDDPVYVALPAAAKPAKPSRKGSVCGDPAIKGVQIAPIRASTKGCGLEDGVRVTSVAGVQLSVPADIDCTTAKALNDWVRDALLPAVGGMGGGVSRLQVAASYVCRPRNGQKGARISEHGKGHAIDISAILLENGKSISVLQDWGSGRAGKILKQVRAGACGPFTTVLGPGSDKFHRDHLHFDTARGRGPYCR